MSIYYAKDFIETAEGLRFAVVKTGLEKTKVLCFLRYAYLNHLWQKLDTFQANQLLIDFYPHYRIYSETTQAYLHAVELKNITHHYQPRPHLQYLLSQKNPDKAVQDCLQLIKLFQTYGLSSQSIGITGSLLINAQNNFSDIDLVFYQRDEFHWARNITANLIQQHKLQALSITDWQIAFNRRQSSLNFDDYVWHERRKYNKALINQRKFDLSLVEAANEDSEIFYKHGFIILTVQIANADQSFDYPAKFLLNHPQIQSILCFTATYYGQAQSGEWVEVSGQLEISHSGLQRIVVGSSREAKNEYIKVISPLEF
jgi:predicted nucleotidyltransferase